MSAGTGIARSESNASDTEPFSSFQVWLYPRSRGGAPRYDRFAYAPEDKHDRFLLALSPDRREGSALLGQDAFFSVATLDGDAMARYAIQAEGNGVYVHCAEGTVELAGVRLGKGDAIGIWDIDGFEVAGIATTELVPVEVPMTRGVNV